MEFSASGLRFEDQLDCQIGDVLLLELRLPSEETGWRGAGKVVRIEAMNPRPPNGPAFRIAIDFIELPDDARTALARASESGDGERTSGTGNVRQLRLPTQSTSSASDAAAPELDAPANDAKGSKT